MDFQKQIDIVRNKIINAAIVATIIFVIPVVIISLSRISRLGWSNIYLAHIFGTLIIFILFFFRKKINLKNRLHIFSSMFFVIALYDAYVFKLAGAAYFFYYQLCLLPHCLVRELALSILFYTLLVLVLLVFFMLME